MLNRSAFLGVCVAALLALLCADVLADGFIVLRRPPRPPRRPLIPLAVKYHHVNVEINDLVAVTKIDQVFRNPNPMQLEGEYIFPLPAGSSVTDFSMYMGGKEVHGELLDAKKAREIYEGIVRRQRDPALLEYLGLRMFRARVFPIPARGETRIKLEYLEELDRNQGQATYRYPLNTEKFSSRPLESVSVNVVLRCKDKLTVVDSPSHNAEVVREGSHLAKIGYEKKNVTPDKDFVVNYAVSSKAFGINVATFKKRGDGFFRIVISPDAELAGTQIQNKVVVFVVDTSLSMSDENKIAQAKKALKYCVHSLRKGDSFNIVDFSTDVRALKEAPLTVTDEHIRWADEYIDEIRARGGTAINEALLTGLKMMDPSDERPFLMVFMTDGRPTFGERDPKRLLENVKKARKGDARIFAFGIGNDVDSIFLDRLAKENGGAREYIIPGEDIEIKVSHFFDKVSYPVLTDLALTVQGLKISDMYPRPLGDLFKGGQLAVHGRYDGDGARAIELRGKIGGKVTRFVYEANFNGKSSGGEFIPRLWAQGAIAHMLEEVRAHGENPELKREIIRLSKKYGIMDNKYVSWLVVEDERRVSDRLRRQGRGLPFAPRPTPGASPSPTPTPTPSGGAFRAAAEKAKEEAGADGRALEDAEAEMKSDAAKGIKAARAIKKMALGKKAGEAHGGKGAIQKIVADKTFYRWGSYWVDADFEVDKDKYTEVVFMSDAYFELMKKHKGINVFLAVSPRVIVKMDGQVYLIVAEKSKEKGD
jgi:Ca-activated chloride channel family protein